MVPDPKFRTCEFVESGPGDIMVRQFQGTSHMIVSAHGATTPQPKICPTWVGGTENIPVPPFSRQVGRIFLC